MKKKIFITLAVYTLIFLLGGVYIITTIGSHTFKMRNLVRLYQIEIQRKRLLLNLKNVQSDLNLRRTPHAKSVDAIVSNVQSLSNLADTCFNCHHARPVVKRLINLKSGVEVYKDLISRVLTLRANRARMMIEDERAFQTAEQLFAQVDSMVHEATDRLSKKTERSLLHISRAEHVLFAVVATTPFMAAFFAYLFIRGLTRPVKELLKATRKIKEGDLTHRIGGLKDEFGEVAASFNEMASRMEIYTRRLEGQTLELEHAHREMSTFCEILEKIGMQQTLQGVTFFLMKELESIIKSPYMVLYVLSGDRSALFALSAKKTELFKKPELIQTVTAVLDGLKGVTSVTQGLFTPPLFPENFPGDEGQIIIPFGIQDYLDGAFVVARSPECCCEEKKLDLVALILNHVAGMIKRAVSQEEKIRFLEDRIESMSGYGGIIGKDPKMQTIYKLIEDVGHTDATVLIQGETGTGKEMVARAIFNQSPRRDKPFVVINCSAYPAMLLESELFGHEKGAFTGAIRQKIGRFEQAHGGTVFLDEIGEIPLPAQIKLLRVIQTQKFERIGGEQTVSVNVRILAATNKNLLQEVQNGNFREDLYYRLNVIPINLPPLRSRRNDIPLLARYFLRKFSSEHGKNCDDFSSAAMRQLLNYHWPGNVRELENSIEHSTVLAGGERIEASDLPSVISQTLLGHLPGEDRGQGTIIENESRLLKKALQECNGNKQAAARCLGISRNTLYRKLKKYQIVLPDLH